LPEQVQHSGAIAIRSTLRSAEEKAGRCSDLENEYQEH